MNPLSFQNGSVHLNMCNCLAHIICKLYCMLCHNKNNFVIVDDILFYIIGMLIGVSVNIIQHYTL